MRNCALTFRQDFEVSSYWVWVNTVGKNRLRARQLRISAELKGTALVIVSIDGKIFRRFGTVHSEANTVCSCGFAYCSMSRHW